MSVWMRRIGTALPWLAIAFVSCVIVLVVLLPASWVTPRFARATQGHVNLIEPSGSLWHGSATLMLAAGPDASAATVLPGRVEWHTAFWPLFAGRVSMQLLLSDAMPDPVHIDASFDGATVSAGGIKSPAALLSGLGAPFNTLDLQGDIHVTWTQWHLIRGNAFGGLTITLEDMISRVSPVKPLGSYRVVLQAQGAASTLDLSTLKGPLLLSGHGTIAGSGTSFHGEASSTPEARDNLSGLLNLLGRPMGPGTVSLDYRR
ncbi:type II secretion system protein N (GspN) [Trinickia symbiotica]|uniref:Type II secretion system protein N n=1 Tax=Trinickia symbiotica TaxID=863227 RepID=A0A2N7X822_9BURK|nr:type II secretion system protein N [Trinickia symbiotica]PMS37615.1 type II secretion system protein N [Trinickia symbiotica]PPK43966.1 type II secretion system protein N (GspN) [Trinickia symbiotica]